MSQLIRSHSGRFAMLTLLACGIAISLVLHREAEAAHYLNPFWTNTSISRERAIGMVANRATDCELGDATVDAARSRSTCVPATCSTTCSRPTYAAFDGRQGTRLAMAFDVTGSLQPAGAIIATFEPTVQDVARETRTALAATAEMLAVPTGGLSTLWHAARIPNVSSARHRVVVTRSRRGEEILTCRPVSDP